jgi:hypothetical protein
MSGQPLVYGRRHGFRLAAVLTCLLAGVTFVAACDDDSPGDAKSEQTTPEDVKAPMSEVLAKLPKIVREGNEAKSAAAEGDFDSAASKFEELHEIWEEVEGTVKDDDADLYERIETAQGLIKDGAENKNSERVATGAADQAAAVQQFVDAN